MKFCSDCENSVPENSSNCSNCGKPTIVNRNEKHHHSSQQKPAHYNDTFLKVLCTLTIIGASISLLSAALTMGSMGAGVEYLIFQTVSILAVIGKLTGAILMLQKRLTGLYMYTVAAGINILLTVAMAFGFNAFPTDNAIPEVLMLISIAVGIAIAVAFLVMYWLPVNRRFLS